jgi:corrinoid protein of di/trimethylamine methyltransferase
MSNQILAAMRQRVIDGDPDTSAQLSLKEIETSLDPLVAINDGYVPGMHWVGEQFAQRNMFLPDMMASAEAMRAAMAVLEPELKRLGTERPMAGTVVLGTTKGDIHEIGKILVGTLLIANGFRVVDLGVDVPGEAFAIKAREVSADIVGVSALLTTTMKSQKSVIEALEKEGMRRQVKVMVGGAPVTRQWAEQIGADGYAKDAMSAVALARTLVQEKLAKVTAEQPA